MSFQTAAGATLGISATLPATNDETGYAALTAILIGEITSIGDFGKEYTLVTHLPLSSRGVKKAKGSYNNGQLSVSAAMDEDDTGQAALQTALDSDDPVALEITAQDGTAYWVQGIVMSYRRSIPDADNVVTVSIVIELNDIEIVKIDAS